VVKRWQKGAAGFTVLTIPIRILLIQEMAGGYLSDGDQDGILALLTEAIRRSARTCCRRSTSTASSSASTATAANGSTCCWKTTIPT